MRPILFICIILVALIAYFALSPLFEKLGKAGFNIYTKVNKNMGGETPKEKDGEEKNEL